MGEDEMKISPAAEFGCICLAAVLATAAVIGYGSQFICDLGRGWR